MAAVVFSLGTSIGGKAVSMGMSDRCRRMGAALGKGKIHFPEKKKADPGRRGKASSKLEKSCRNRAQK